MSTTEAKNVFLYRHDGASQGGKLMARALGVRIIRPEGSAFSGGKGKVVINWGTSNFPYELRGAHIENKPEAVGNATNKRSFFELARESGGVPIPEFTTRKAEALDWLRNNRMVFARNRLTGSGGEGIIELSTPDDIGPIADGTLFVEYVRKKHEYRIHVADGRALDVQEKKKKKDVPAEEVNYRIRNLANGFVFCRGDADPPEAVTQAAIEAVRVCGLDFGAVDVVYNTHHNRVAVLEVNTAPGVEGTTAVKYFEHFSKKFGLDESRVKDKFDIDTLVDVHGIKKRED